jgi:hypothetical protein
MNTTIAAVMLVAIALAFAFVGVVVSNVAVMIAGLPCAFAVIGIAAWEERRERRS